MPDFMTETCRHDVAGKEAIFMTYFPNGLREPSQLILATRLVRCRFCEGCEDDWEG